jgi:hypothetical protein
MKSVRASFWWLTLFFPQWPTLAPERRCLASALLDVRKARKRLTLGPQLENAPAAALITGLGVRDWPVLRIWPDAILRPRGGDEVVSDCLNR